MPARRAVFIGTAGWSVPRQYSDAFPAHGSHLERYAQLLNCAEINSSFYKPHRRMTYERWAASTPTAFRFAIKAPKLMTHDQRLAGCSKSLDDFAEQIGGLGRKLGAVLVQLPPSLPFDKRTSGSFFQAAISRLPAPIVCEPRHASWFSEDAEAWLAERRIARVAADPALVMGAGEPGGWRGITYVRLHGSPRMYYSAYGAGAMAKFDRLLATNSKPAWCIFDNTAASAALGDALLLAKRASPGR